MIPMILGLTNLRLDLEQAVFLQALRWLGLHALRWLAPVENRHAGGIVVLIIGSKYSGY